MTTKSYRSTKLHADLVPKGRVSRNGNPVKTFSTYEKAVKALDAAKGQGWHIIS